MRRFAFYSTALVFFLIGCQQNQKESISSIFSIEIDSISNSITVFNSYHKPVLVQNALPNFRPFIHPLMSPDDIGELTEYSPGHHKHQTGIYWGFTRVNGRDFFHHPDENYWRRIDYRIQRDSGNLLSWSTSYEMLDSLGEVIMTETQNWAFSGESNRYILDLEWQGQAAQEVTIGEYDYGGLFIRMPWKEGIPVEVINAARDHNQRAEGKRAMWLDLGMQVEGRSDMAHLAIFDHPQNGGFPHPWRVDGQFGVGPSRARLGKWQIPKGHTEIIKHRMEVYTESLSDVELNDRWEAFAGNEGMYSTASLWGIAQDEGRSAKFLTPEEAVSEMTIKDGYQVNVWAAEPDITQPMAFCYDHQGRLWVAENRDYESRGSGFSNSGDSRILILEDTNHDGRADSRKVFLEGIAFPAAIAVGFDGLFLGAPPHLLFVPDRDHDDKAEVEDIEIRLTGWGIRDRHETLNSFHWGPDGWLYGCQGFATPSVVRKPRQNEKLYRHKDPFPADLLEDEGTKINGGIWRYHPTKELFEVVAHGFSNPWGIDYDQHGQLFITACVIPHLWQIIPGGIYQRQGGQHFNPYTYEDIQTIADHRHRSAHGGARIYQSDAFDQSQTGKIFMANIHEHAILTDELVAKGSGFAGKHSEDFLLANNAQWIGFSLEIGPDGGIYVLDWHDADICGKEVVNKETGRIFRIMPQQSRAQSWQNRFGDLTLLADLELSELQTSPSNWHVRRARLILQERAQKGRMDPNATAHLQKILNDGALISQRLNALWTLHNCHELTESALVNLIEDDNEYVRSWAIQFLSENGLNEKIIKKFTEMASTDPSPTVRLYLAAMLQRIPVAERWDVLAKLVTQSTDTLDHNIPLMLWFAIEPLVKQDPEKLIQLTEISVFSKINRFIGRRIVDEGKIELLVSKLSPGAKNNIDLLAGMQSALEGRTDIKEPQNWSAKQKEFNNSKPAIKNLIQSINQQFGNQEAVRQMMAILDNGNMNPVDQINAIQQLANRKQEELVTKIPQLIDHENLRLAVIRAIAQYDNNDLGRLLLKKYANYSIAEKTEIINTLSTRPGYGWLLTRAIDDGIIPKNDIPAYIARQLRRVVGSGFVEIWGPIDEPDADIRQSYIMYQNLVKNADPGQIDIVKGAEIFERTCGICHKMYGEGGAIGPELTGSNRTNLDYLLTNILEPSAEIQDDYRMMVITMRDGRSYTGNKIGETDRQLTIRIVGQDEVILNKSEIQSTELTSLSLMPTGLLKNMSDEEIINLLGFLTQKEIQ